MATTPPNDRKIDIGSVVQRGFQALGRQLPAFLGLAVLFAGLPAFLIQLRADGLADSSGAVNMFTPAFGAETLLSALAGYLLQAAVVRSAILDLNDRPADIGGSLLVALKLMLPMIGLTIISTVAIWIGLILLVVPGVILYLMWLVAVPVLVEERRGVFGSLSRSAELTKGSRWRIFALLLLFGVGFLVISAAIGAIGLLAPSAVPSVFSAITSGAISTCLAVLGATMLASLYIELKTIKEGATTETLAAIFD